MSTKNLRNLVYFSLFSALLISVIYSPTNYYANTAIWPTEEWEMSTLKKQGIIPKKIRELEEYVEDHNVGVISMLIVRNGYLVDTKY